LHLTRRNICIDIVGPRTNLVRAVGLQAGIIAAAVLAASVLEAVAAAALAKAVKT
jgi:hypothetical protein